MLGLSSLLCRSDTESLRHFFGLKGKVRAQESEKNKKVLQERMKETGVDRNQNDRMTPLVCLCVCVKDHFDLQGGTKKIVKLYPCVHEDKNRKTKVTLIDTRSRGRREVKKTTLRVIRKKRYVFDAKRFLYFQVMKRCPRGEMSNMELRQEHVII